MKARIIDKSDVLKIVDSLREEGFKVYATFLNRGHDSTFDLVTDDNKNDIKLHLPNPYYPPKRFLIPHIEQLLNIRKNKEDIELSENIDSTRKAIFGIRSCDLNGINHLDRFYLGGKFTDPYYASRRRNLFLVNVVCTDTEQDIDENCFCLCADTGPAAREFFDLQLMDLGDELMVVAGNSKGEEFFKFPYFKKCTQAHVNKRGEILARVRHQFKPNAVCWFSAAIRLITEGKVPENTWELIGNRCFECGGCTYVCPVCTCFTVSEHSGPNGQVVRTRIWDSCALGGFTRMAGGFNPRKAIHDRRNRRFFRKLAHYFIQRELSVACAGCGRCRRVCHGDVGMPSVVEILRKSIVTNQCNSKNG